MPFFVKFHNNNLFAKLQMKIIQYFKYNAHFSHMNDRFYHDFI